MIEPRKVEMTSTVKYLVPVFNSDTGECDLVEKEIKTFVNPFLNLLDMVEYYYSIEKNNDIEELREFVVTYDSDHATKLISNLDMYSNFILSMYYNSINPAENDEWNIYDSQKVEELLKDPFFDEYNKTRKQLELYCKRSYPMLDVYSFVKLQAYASTILPKEELWDIQYEWTHDDFIVQIYELGWFDVIATIYKSYGIHWFCHGGENDPILYKWACYAVSACKKSGLIENQELKKDLTDIYKELLIAFTIRGTVDKNKDIVDFVQSCITNFDEEHINSLVRKLQTLSEQQDRLIDEKKQLNEGLEMLRSQIKELQHEKANSNFDNVEQIAYRIYCLSPQNSEMDNSVEKFKNIWDKLSDCTKKDIKLSISMFDKFESYDIALFPMIRSLEYEFARNFFEPFYNSKNYRNITIPLCKDSKYEKTHSALIKKANSYPTIGNIPFIGKAMTNVNAQSSSNVIKGFKEFLGKNRVAFVSICKLLDNYKITTQQYKLVDIRNGIAHGDVQITANVDKQCYEEVSKLLYEPPLQILFEIINSSMR